jgi:hypothetical protein
MARRVSRRKPPFSLLPKENPMNAVEKWSVVSLLLAGQTQAADSVARLVAAGATKSAVVVVLTVGSK